MIKTLPYKVAILSEQLSKEKAYWQTKLSGDIEKAMFPGELAKENSFAEEVVRYTLPDELCSQSLKLSNNSDLRLHIVFLAAVNALLYKYTGVQDLVTGTSVYKPVTEGELLNTVLPLRNRLMLEMTFKELLLSVRQELKEATDNQHYPLIYLSNSRGSLAPDKANLFDVAVVLENIQDRGHLKPVQPAVIFSFTKKDKSIELGVYYNASLYKRTFIERLIVHFEQVLKQTLFNVDVLLADLCLLTDEERDQILFRFNNTSIDYPKERKIHQLVEEQVTKTPDATALVVGDKQLTYKELNRKANQLAQYLCKGTQSNERIGILMPRSEWMVVSMLAVLKSGGAYVPFDPVYPIERINYIARDAKISTLITTKELSALLPGLDTKILLPEEAIETIDVEPDDVPDKIIPGEVAYIIYTSGSTGKPKGTVIRHESTVNLLYWGKDVFSKAELQGVLASTSICFDLSVFELFLPLVTGGKVILADHLLHLTSLPHKGEVTLVNTVPSVLASFLISNELPSEVKVVNLAGEPLTRALANQLAGRKDVKVYNLYGPSETTTYSTFSLVEQESTQPPSIGKPISNTRLYILDEGLQPVPVRVTGELYIGGVGLAREYLNQAALTKERFIEDPFVKGERMYKTGDAGRWKADGSIDYTGRIDQQVKIRGLRIETGEIENCLLQHPAIKEAAVVARQKEKEVEKFLAAYMVGTQTRLPVAEVKNYLAQYLPEYMLPVYYEQLDALPLTANGKVDKKALTARKIKWRPYVEPKEEIQKKVAAIWQQVLAVEEPVGLEHNFFELGGHSLNAIRIINRIHQELNIEVPLSFLLNRPTVKAFAEFVAFENSAGQVIITPQPQRANYPTSPAQKRVYVAHQFNESGVDNNVPFILQIEGALRPKKVEKVLKELIERHESLRTSFEVVDQEIVQIIHGKIDFRLAYEEIEAADVQLLIRNFVRPFDLQKAPLFRGALVKRGDEDYLLMMDMHHIVSDGGTLEILINEFECLYKGEVLPPPAVHYKDYATWLSEFQQSQKQKQQEAYWLEELKGNVPLAELPVDFDRLTQETAHFNSLQLRLDKEFLAELQQVAATHQVTLFMVLLSAYNVLLYRYSKQKDIIVSTPVAGRPYHVLQNMVGMFVNLLAIRSELTENKSFSTLLLETKQKVLKAHENQLVQIDDLLNKLDVKRKGTRLFNTSFLFYNIGRLTRETGNIKLTRYEQAEATLGLYDLALEVIETTDVLQISAEYNAALFRKITMEQLMAAYKNILEQIVKDPEFLIGETPLPGNQLVHGH